MSNFVLQVSSAQQVSIFPEFDFKEPDQKTQTQIRARSSRHYVYKFSGFKAFDFSVTLVNSSFRAIVNSWWNTNTTLQFYEVQSGSAISDVSTVRIMNTSKPIDGYVLPYTTLFEGKIRLETVL